MKRYYCKCGTAIKVKVIGLHTTPECDECGKKMKLRADYDQVN